MCPHVGVIGVGTDANSKQQFSCAPILFQSGRPNLTLTCVGMTWVGSAQQPRA